MPNPDGDVQQYTSHFHSLITAHETKRTNLTPQSSVLPAMGFGAGPPNKKALRTMMWWADGEIGNLPDRGKRQDRALELVRTIEHDGHYSIGPGTELLSSTHSQLWLAAIFGGMWGYAKSDREAKGRERGLQVFDGLLKMAQTEMALWSAHRAIVNGKVSIWCEGARCREHGTAAPSAVNRCRDLIWAILTHEDERLVANVKPNWKTNDKYLVGALACYYLPSEVKQEIAKGVGMTPVNMPCDLHVRRLNDGRFASWLVDINALDPALSAGVGVNGPWVSQSVSDDVAGLMDMSMHPDRDKVVQFDFLRKG